MGVAPLPAEDFDGDGLADHLDLDSDNDGLPDVFESLGSGVDNDGDGKIDNIVDANNDGLADGINANTLLDSDNDSAPNHLDLDSDNDDITDIVEAGGLDADNDGQVDAWADSDADGIPDSVDADIANGIDSDGDGIVDIADADFVNLPDTDGDGIVDSFDGNPLGDGFIPFSSEPLTSASLPDSNGNNIPDLYEVAAEVTEVGLPQAANLAGQTHVGLTGNGCAIGGPDQKRDPINILMILLASVWLLLVRISRRPARDDD